MYAAKGDGRGIHRFFRKEMLDGAKTRKQLEDDLRGALVGDQFHVAYQPVVSTEGARIVGYEALIRWNHPTRGAVSPAEFIPIAEECGLIESIGEWVLRTACREAASWPEHVRVAVNVSPIQFANPALPAIVTSALASIGHRARAARARDHRGRVPQRERVVRPDVQVAQGDRRAAGARRFRHRLFVARLSEEGAVRQDQDRPELRARRRRRPATATPRSSRRS